MALPRRSSRPDASADHPAGHVVLLTGAARGIGAETARRLAARGARLVLVDLDGPALEELAGELTRRHGAEVVEPVVADVRDLDSLEAAVERGLARFGRLDRVVANAGISSYGSVAAVDPAAFRQVLEVNLLGVFHTVRAALPALVAARGYVLVVSSLAAFAPAPGLAAYNATKAGVEHFANALRLEVHHQGVGVGVAHMSWVDTPLVRDAQADLSGFAQMLARLGPLGRTTEVGTCADAFVRALERRSRRVSVPGWVGAVRQARNLVCSSLGDRRVLPLVPDLLPLMDADAARLGRWTSARTAALDRTDAPS